MAEFELVAPSAMLVALDGVCSTRGTLAAIGVSMQPAVTLAAVGVSMQPAVITGHAPLWTKRIFLFLAIFLCIVRCHIGLSKHGVETWRHALRIRCRAGRSRINFVNFTTWPSGSAMSVS